MKKNYFILCKKEEELSKLLQNHEDFKKEIDKTNVELAATNKILEKHQGNIDQLIEANAATNGAAKLEPSKK